MVIFGGKRQPANALRSRISKGVKKSGEVGKFLKMKQAGGPNERKEVSEVWGGSAATSTNTKSPK